MPPPWLGTFPEPGPPSPGQTSARGFLSELFPSWLRPRWIPRLLPTCQEPVFKPAGLCPSLELLPHVGVSRPGFPFPGCAATGGRAAWGSRASEPGLCLASRGEHFRGSGHAPAERARERTLGCEQGLEPSCPPPLLPHRPLPETWDHSSTSHTGFHKAQWFCRYCLTGEGLNPGS